MLCNERSWEKEIVQQNGAPSRPQNVHTFGISNLRKHGKACNMFYSRLSQLISDKRNLSKLITMNWIRTKVCFMLLKSSLLCLWLVCRKVSEFECDIDVSHEHAKIWII